MSNVITGIRCPDCGITKQSSDYTKRGNSLYPACKVCKNKKEKERRDKNRDAINVAERNRYATKKTLVQTSQIQPNQLITRLCTACGENKPETEFYVHSGKGTIRSECMVCASKNRKEYYKNNREKVVKQTTAYKNNKIKTNPAFKMEQRLRTRIYIAFTEKGLVKKERTFAYLNCTRSFFQEWIQFQLYDGMTPENYGKVWHIDHADPCANFDLNNDNDAKKCFHWSNCRPYLKEKNLLKGDDIDSYAILLQELKAKVFEKEYKARNNL